MPRADALALVRLLGGIETQNPQITNYYADIATDLAHQGVFTTWLLVPAVKNQGGYDLGTDMVEVLGVFYDDTLLSRASFRELEAHDPQWRDRIGRPICYTAEQESRHAIELYPAPDANSDVENFVNGAPFGLDYPRGTIALIVSEVRVDYPTWIDLPYALAIMALEFQRDSDHRNTAFADASMALGGLLMAMVVGD